MDEMPLLNRLFGLQGQVAAVVGGAGRIGRAICRGLAEAGADVAVVDVDEGAAVEAADGIREAIGAAAQRVLPVPCDAAREDHLQRTVERITTELGPPGILVNSAQFRGAGFYSSDAESYPREAWEQVLQVNLTAVHLACQAFGRAMTQHGGGRIVNLASTYGVVSPDPRIYGASGVNSPVSYAASKAGVIQLTRYLAVHWREHNIRVNCLVPGGVYDGQGEEFVAHYEARTPLARMARAEDYQGAVLFMSSPASDYMTALGRDGRWRLDGVVTMLWPLTASVRQRKLTPCPPCS